MFSLKTCIQATLYTMNRLYLCINVNIYIYMYIITVNEKNFREQ